MQKCVEFGTSNTILYMEKDVKKGANFTTKKKVNRRHAMVKRIAKEKGKEKRAKRNESGTGSRFGKGDKSEGRDTFR